MINMLRAKAYVDSEYNAEKGRDNHSLRNLIGEKSRQKVSCIVNYREFVLRLAETSNRHPSMLRVARLKEIQPSI